MITLQKPAYRSPCNNCGLCCQIELCEVATMTFPEGTKAPCPALVEVEAGKRLCMLVIAEKSTGQSIIHDGLGIGFGCSMPDEDTTEQEIDLFDEQCMLAFIKKRESLTPADRCSPEF